MKNLSIRTRILAGVVLVNLLGAMGVMVYLHQSYSNSLDTVIARTGTQGLAAWEEIKGVDVVLDPIAQPQEAANILESMKAVTGVDYGLLIDKGATDQATYSAAREVIGEASAWEERDNYALLASTDEDLAQDMHFELAPSEVPENSRVIGVEVGSCTKTCHDGITGEGDYWTIRWSNSSSSKGHAVFPVFAAGTEPVGVIYAIENISDQADAANKGMMQTLFAVALTLIVATLTIGMLLDLLVLRRLAGMTKGIQEISMRVAGGDFNAHYDPDGTTDEIGSFEKFFSDFINLVSITLKQLSGQ
jgi:HAMP domain-containing protein